MAAVTDPYCPPVEPTPSDNIPLVANSNKELPPRNDEEGGRRDISWE